MGDAIELGLMMLARSRGSRSRSDAVRKAWVTRRSNRKAAGSKGILGFRGKNRMMRTLPTLFRERGSSARGRRRK